MTDLRLDYVSKHINKKKRGNRIVTRPASRGSRIAHNSKNEQRKNPRRYELTTLDSLPIGYRASIRIFTSRRHLPLQSPWLLFEFARFLEANKLSAINAIIYMSSLPYLRTLFAEIFGIGVG